MKLFFNTRFQYPGSEYGWRLFGVWLGKVFVGASVAAYFGEEACNG